MKKLLILAVALVMAGCSSSVVQHGFEDDGMVTGKGMDSELRVVTVGFNLSKQYRKFNQHESFAVSKTVYDSLNIGDEVQFTKKVKK